MARVALLTCFTLLACTFSAALEQPELEGTNTARVETRKITSEVYDRFPHYKQRPKYKRKPRREPELGSWEDVDIRLAKYDRDPNYMKIDHGVYIREFTRGKSFAPASLDSSVTLSFNVRAPGYRHQIESTGGEKTLKLSSLRFKKFARAVSLMCAGSEFDVVLAPQHAYAGGNSIIPANTLVVFATKLVSVNDAHIACPQARHKLVKEMSGWPHPALDRLMGRAVKDEL